MIDKVLKILLPKRTVLIIVAIFGLFGYTLWHMQEVMNPRADQGYLNSKRNPANSNNKIQIKDSVKQQIEQLQDTPLNLQPGKLGKPDPFNP